MANWLASMEQTFEFYVVDPYTWGDIERLTTVKSCTINRDSTAETLGSASFSVDESVGECYIRVYLVTIQNGIREKHPLGTFLVQTPSSTYTGKVREVTMDAYTPLIELKENPPPIGYTVVGKRTVEGVEQFTNILDIVTALASENMRGPVVGSKASKNVDPSIPNTEDFSNTQTLSETSTELLRSDFIASSSDTWLTFLTDLLAVSDRTFALDEMGRVLFASDVEADAMQPVWTFDDGNSSILYPELTMDHDMFGIPNHVEVIYSTALGTKYCEKYNRDPNSPTSVQKRGRVITYRDTDPDIHSGFYITAVEAEDYAVRLLKKLSTVSYTITFTHGYCPVRLGDCVRLDYTRAGLTNIKAKVIAQSIECEPGCPVTTTAVYTTKLWEGGITDGIDD